MKDIVPQPDKKSVEFDKKQIAKKVRGILRQRFPGRYNYVPLIAELLGVHELTVHSKLRGDSPFKLEEFYLIAKEFDLPIEDIFNDIEYSKLPKHPLEIYIHDLSCPEETDEIAQQTLAAFRLTASTPNSKYMVATNNLPNLVFANQEWIAKFEHLKWLYFNQHDNKPLRLSDIHFTDKEQGVHTDYLSAIQKFRTAMYILHVDMMRFITQDIIFFYNLNMLDQSEARLLLVDYSNVLDKLQMVCNNGIQEPNGRKVFIYFSNILLPNDITLLESEEMKVAIVYAYFQNPIVTKRTKTFGYIRDWFNTIANASNLISMNDPKQRMEFFRKQRQFINDCRHEIGIE